MPTAPSNAHGWHRIATLLAVGVVAVALGQNASAASLVFAFSELPPWKTVDGSQFNGAYTEIVRELARRTGFELEIFQCPFKRCLKMMQDGQADVIIGVHESDERKAYIHFLRTPYRKTSSDKVFYVRKGQAALIRSYEDLKKLRIGVKSGTQYFDRFDADNSLTKDGAKDSQSNLKKLLRGRVDAVLMPEDQGEPLVYSLQLQDQLDTALYREQDHTPRAIGISKKSVHAQHIPVFEAAMAAMVKDGTVKALFKRYYFDAYNLPHELFHIE